MAKIVKKFQGALLDNTSAAGIASLLCLFQRGYNIVYDMGITIAKFGATHIIQIIYIRIVPQNRSLPSQLVHALLWTTIKRITIQTQWIANRYANQAYYGMTLSLYDASTAECLHCTVTQLNNNVFIYHLLTGQWIQENTCTLFNVTPRDWPACVMTLRLFLIYLKRRRCFNLYKTITTKKVDSHVSLK